MGWKMMILLIDINILNIMEQDDNDVNDRKVGILMVDLQN